MEGGTKPRPVRRRLSVENVVSIVAASVAVLSGAVGIWHQRDAADSAEQASRAAERSAQQAFVMTQQDKFIEGATIYAERLGRLQRAGTDVGQQLAGLSRAKTLQRRARAAIFAEDYDGARALLDDAFEALEGQCPPEDPTCAGQPTP
jgi:hypothetical protein